MGQLNTIVPEKEPERQYYFIELLKDEIKKKSRKKRRKPYLSHPDFRMPDECKGF